MTDARNVIWSEDERIAAKVITVARVRVVYQQGGLFSDMRLIIRLTQLSHRDRIM